MGVRHVRANEIPNDRATIEGDGFAVAVTRFDPESGWGAWHHHGEHQVVAYLMAGTIRVESDGDVTEASAGDVVHIEPGTIHREDYGTDEVVSIGCYFGSGPGRVDVDGPEGPAAGERDG